VSNRAIDYAEDVLNVHHAYRNAQAALEALHESLNHLNRLKARRTSLNERFADRRASLVSEERGKHPDQGVTRFDEHIKTQERKDEELTGIRLELQDVGAEITRIEYDVDMQKATIRVLSARMEELGGYLNYLASVKAAETATLRIAQTNLSESSESSNSGVPT